MSWAEITAYIELLLLVGAAMTLIILVNTTLNKAKITTNKYASKSGYLENQDFGNSFITRDDCDHSNSYGQDLGLSCDASDFDNSTCD